MTQSNPIPEQEVQQEQPPAVCPVCETWTLTPYAARYTTPIPGSDGLGLMVMGFWLACRGATESQLCQQHRDMLIRLDVQKFQLAERARVEAEAARAAEEAAKPKYPTAQHGQIAANLLERIHQVNAPPALPMVPPRMIQPVLSADPNTFPCPDCQQPVRNGEVHRCNASA